MKKQSQLFLVLVFGIGMSVVASSEENSLYEDVPGSDCKPREMGILIRDFFALDLDQKVKSYEEYVQRMHDALLASNPLRIETFTEYDALSAEEKIKQFDAFIERAHKDEEGYHDASDMGFSCQMVILSLRSLFLNKGTHLSDMQVVRILRLFEKCTQAPSGICHGIMGFASVGRRYKRFASHCLAYLYRSVDRAKASGDYMALPYLRFIQKEMRSIIASA